MRFFQKKKYLLALPPPQKHTHTHVPIQFPQNVINGFLGPSFPGVRRGERAHNTREGLNVVSSRLMKSFVFGAANALRKFAPPLTGVHGEDLVGIIIPTTTTSKTEVQTNVRRPAARYESNVTIIINNIPCETARRPDKLPSEFDRPVRSNDISLKHANSQ